MFGYKLKQRKRNSAALKRAFSVFWCLDKIKSESQKRESTTQTRILVKLQIQASASKQTRFWIFSFGLLFLLPVYSFHAPNMLPFSNPLSNHSDPPLYPTACCLSSLKFTTTQLCL
jgi:hypothetical protein